MVSHLERVEGKLRGSRTWDSLLYNHMGLPIIKGTPFICGISQTYWNLCCTLRARTHARTRAQTHTHTHTHISVHSHIITAAAWQQFPMVDINIFSVSLDYYWAQLPLLTATAHNDWTVAFLSLTQWLTNQLSTLHWLTDS
jgi:hypothetical protein